MKNALERGHGKRSEKPKAIHGQEMSVGTMTGKKAKTICSEARKDMNFLSYEQSLSAEKQNNSKGW